jgi:small subunit ribosomal protein S20
MANNKSAEKRIRQTKRRTGVNHPRVSEMRTSIRKVEEAIASGDKTQAQAAFKSMQPLMMKGVSKKLIHRNTLARKLSRLSTRIKALGA